PVALRRPAPGPVRRGGGGGGGGGGSGLRAPPAARAASVWGARGPFSLDGERALFERLACDVLVSKNSGSQATEPKLQVAREMGLPVLVLARPALPPADREFADGEALLAAIRDWESA
ncbi:precorrin-6A/cobalt-precorrin-6A reductase, partial [Pseudomonas aeruginosa]|uniref:precorrin-6A/cobalt-precorrin-6A reductase n=1 Tax=Pseudomonas aeruginosa TaxID=287 RepID=UPI0021F1AC5F